MYKYRVPKNELRQAFETIAKTGYKINQLQMNTNQKEEALEKMESLFAGRGEETPRFMKNTLSYAMECIVKVEDKDYNHINQSHLSNLRGLYTLFDAIDKYSDRNGLKDVLRYAYSKNE